MQTMFIVRLLDAERNVLAWTKIPAETKGDGRLWAMQAFVAEVEQNGIATALNYHWTDVHCYTTVQLASPVSVVAGQVISLPLADLIYIPSEPLPLPAVTVRSNVTACIGTVR